MVHTYVGAENTQESVKYFIAAANSPNYLDPASAYENAGLCSMKMASYKQAAQYFNQALLKDPGRSMSLLKLAEIDIKLGNIKEAKALMASMFYLRHRRKNPINSLSN